MRYVHTNLRVRDIATSRRFYGLSASSRAGGCSSRAPTTSTSASRATTLELTVNEGREEPYDLGEGYGHIALEVEDLDGLLASLASHGIEPEKPPYNPGGREELEFASSPIPTATGSS